MPSPNPRINLTLSPDVDAAVGRLVRVSGVGKATVIGQMLQEALPQLELMAQALEQAKRRNLDAFDTMIGAVQTAQVGIDQMAFDLRSERRERRRAPMRKRP